jgi:biotin-(acetyl-CoA carboxylase) ligase
LIESDYTGWRLGTIVVGIGINLTASPEVDEHAYPVRCLAQIASSPIPTAEQFAERLAERIIDRLSDDCHSTIPEWMAALRLIGRTVHLRSTNEPVLIIGFDSDGSLRAMDQSGSLRILRDGDSLLYDPFVP